MTPSPYRKMINLLITCFRQYDILAKTHSRMTTAITFSRENAGSCASNTQYWRNLVLVVVLVLESKALYCWVTKVAEQNNILKLYNDIEKEFKANKCMNLWIYELISNDEYKLQIGNEFLHVRVPSYPSFRSGWPDQSCQNENSTFTLYCPGSLVFSLLYVQLQYMHGSGGFSTRTLFSSVLLYSFWITSRSRKKMSGYF